MVHPFRAFVDESGSEGDSYKPGGCEFIILTAVVFRETNLQFAREIWMNAARIKRKPLTHFDRDFKDTNSDKDKFLIACLLAQAPMRWAGVIVHKPSLNKLGDSYGDIYHYASQLLLERISWICRDAHAISPERNPKCRITFSERKNLRADKFRKYAMAIVAGKGPRPSNVAADFIDLRAIDDKPHAGCTYLRVADWLAASMGAAVEILNKTHGLTDDRFLLTLLRRAYFPEGKKVWTNGIKLFPPEAESDQTLLGEDRFRWVKTHCK